MNSIIKRISIISTVTVLLGSVVYGIGFKNLNKKSEIKLSKSDLDYAIADINNQIYTVKNGKHIIDDRNKEIEDNYAVQEFNDLITKEESNPTENKPSLSVNDIEHKENKVSKPKVVESTSNNKEYQADGSLERIVSMVENSTDDQIAKGKVLRDEENAKYLINREKELEKARIEKENRESYNRGREDEVITMDEYYQTPEFKEEYEKKWKEIQRLYGQNQSTAAAQDPTRTDSLQRPKEYSRGGNNRYSLHIDSGHILNKNIYIPSGLSASQFNSALEGTGIEGLGQAFVDMENNWGVDGLFCMAVAFHESANGYSRLAVNNNNLFGMRSRNGWKKFDSKYDAIVYFGEYMNKNLYKGKSVYEIGNIYCPPNTDQWFDGVNRHYEKILNKI